MADTEKIFSRLQNGNDIRGAAIAANGEERTLTPDLAQFAAAAFAGWLADRLGREASSLRVGVGHDSRVTAQEIKEGVLKGLSGVQAFDCGLASTPSMFQSTVLEGSNFDGAVMITASHLPFNRNGIKVFTKDGSPEKADMTEILARAAKLAEQYGEEDPEAIISARQMPAGGIPAQKFDMVSLYCEHMKAYIKEAVKAEDYDKPLAGSHIIVDAGNGAAGFFATKILEPLGADTAGSVYLEPDGTFPNHIPNPENREAIEACRKATVDAGADLGVIFDCDGDRGAVVFADGTEVNRNTLIALLAAIVSEQHPGSTVVTDSVTSDELSEFLTGKLGMRHLRYKRGYKNVIDKGIELNKAGTDCELAIETSGHGAFRDNYFSDDGAYIAVRVICKMAQLKREGRRIEDLIADLAQPAESAEVRYTILEEDYKAYGQKVLEEFAAFARRQPLFHIVEPNYEGVRVSFDDEQVKGWMLIRQSLHDPVMPMNIESRGKGGVQVIMDRLAPFFADKALRS